MKKIALALLALAAGASSVMAQSPEGLKSANWTGGSWRAQAVVALPVATPKLVVEPKAEEVQFRPVPMPPPHHVHVFTSTFYRFQHEAERAREWKVRELHREGFHVMDSRVIRTHRGWFFEIRYERRGR